MVIAKSVGINIRSFALTLFILPLIEALVAMLVILGILS